MFFKSASHLPEPEIIFHQTNQYTHKLMNTKLTKYEYGQLFFDVNLFNNFFAHDILL